MAAPAKNVPTVLDPSALDQLRALQRPGRPNLVERVVGLFRTDASKRLSALETAAVEQDWVSLRREAHTLKSSAANVGAVGMREVAAEMERAMMAARHDDALALIPALREHFEAVLNALDEGEGG